ncbi:MAG: hypothetical protein AUK55_01060 [Syntrophobacteraceae bacterium CG2_30_61_12]|nr:MAG: hypothetical protein AUK55_01060 [Syntrophobacteraceae bacterium CG2_30_61_12]
MDRAIFDLKLSVEATSLYILICAHTVGVEAPNSETLIPLWNGSREQFQSAAAELAQRGILLNSVPPAATEPLRIASSHCWS